MKKLIAVASVAAISNINAAWTVLDLPDTTGGGNTAMGHLADGRFVYGHGGTMLVQNSFGSNATSAYANAPAGDYAFLTSKYFGSGSWGGGPVASYDSGNLATAFTTIGTHQTYAGINYGSSGLLYIGTVGGTSTLVHLAEDNTTNVLITPNISQYSAGFTVDGAGNLYVADNDDQNIYKFTSAQIAAAVAGTPLSMAAGSLVANLGVSGSLAFDDVQNRLYAAGWQTSGIRFFDLDDSTSGTLVPGLANTNYQVMTFSDGSNDYVGWLNRSGWNGVDAMTYGYDLAANVPVPEPGTFWLLALGCGAAAWVRRRRRA
jgi:hypothetical protein